MKKSAWIIAIIALAMSACTSQKQATSYVNDDVYGSPTRYEQTATAPATATTQGAQVITAPDKAKVQKPASSTLEQDYSDYSYTNRINRFSNKDTTVGYFDDAYTQSTTTTSSEPNVNIYLGAGTGYGGYYGSSFGFGWGYPYSSWGMDYGWGYPYYGGYYGFGYPYYGYNSWYSPYYDPWYSPCCYCYGYNDYYPPYYNTNMYYGSRTSLYRTDGGMLNARSSAVNGNNAYNARNAGNAGNERNAGGAYTRTGQGDVTPSPRTTGQSSVRSTPANQEKYRYTRPATQGQSGYQRTTKQNPGQVQNQVTRQQPTPRYIRPENAGAVQRTGSAQSYSSPVYRQPKSSQEYLAPRSQNPGTTRGSGQATETRTGSSVGATRQSGDQGSGRRTYTPPTRSGSSGYSTPTRTTQEYSAPTRSGNSGSYSAPTRSGSSGTYSAPSNSNSGGSYSAPARSGGNSGGSSGGSGSSSGGGRRR